MQSARALNRILLYFFFVENYIFLSVFLFSVFASTLIVAQSERSLVCFCALPALQTVQTITKVASQGTSTVLTNITKVFLMYLLEDLK